MDQTQRIVELERTIHRAWLLLGGCNDPTTVLALLPGGGKTCQRLAEIALDELGRAIGKPTGFRRATASDMPTSRNLLDNIAEQVMSECHVIHRDSGAPIP
ncbi:hypothetical protein ACO2I3_18945 [Leptospira interrogans]